MSKALLNASFSSIIDAHASELEAYANEVEERIFAALSGTGDLRQAPIRATEFANEIKQRAAALTELSNKFSALRESICEIGSQAE